jgi:hypothetical protein
MPTSLSDFAVDVGLRAPLRVTCTHGITGRKEVIELTQPYAVIGRAVGCTIRLIDPSVAERQAYLQVINGLPHVLALGQHRNVLRLGGQEATDGWLSDGQSLGVGAFDLEVSGCQPAGENGPLPAEDHPGDPSPIILVHADDPSGLSGQPLPRPLTVIGRHAACNFRILDPRVRSFHAAVVCTASAAWLVNLRSPERVRLNGRPVRSSRLTAGDHLELNGLTLEVRWNRPWGGGRLDPVVGNGESVTLPAFAAADGSGDMRHHTLMMAKLFAALQEQIAVQQRQTELLQDIRDAVKNGNGFHAPRPDTDQPVPLQLSHTPPSPLTPKTAAPEAVPALTDAHNWLLARLGALGK